MPALRTLAAASAAATLIFAAAAAATPITSWDYTESRLQYGVYDDNNNPDVQDYNFSPAIGATALDNGIKIYSPNDGNLTFSLTGKTYIGTPTPNTLGAPAALRGNRLVITGSASISGPLWQDPDDYISTAFEFGFDFTGGELDLYAVQTSFLLTDSEGGFVVGVGSGTSLGVFEPGGYGVGFEFQDRFNGPIPTATNILWSVEIYYDWTNQDADDALSFYISENSIDITAVPTPGTASLLALAGLTTARRRRA